MNAFRTDGPCETSVGRDRALHRPYLARPAGAPWLIGLASSAAGAVPYPLSLRDVEADTAWALRVYGRLGLVPGEMVHLVGDGADEVSWWPFENAAMRSGIPWIEAEASPHDVARSDMVLRRFALQGALGLSEPLVSGLIALGRDLAALLAPLRALTATPAAARLLRARGLRPWTQVAIGPVFAFEPPEGGGAAYDEREWRIESLDGELALTAVGPRAAPFARLRTGLRGRVERAGTESRVFLD